MKGSKMVMGGPPGSKPVSPKGKGIGVGISVVVLAAIVSAGALYMLAKKPSSTSVEEKVVVATLPSEEVRQPVEPKEETVVKIEPVEQEHVEPVEIKNTYVVKEGDYLWVIAGKPDIYGNSFKWVELYRANKDKIRNPHLIYPGQKLTVSRN
ncbi:LysM peptidoglycan-binding domain-containing protein [bacterium]|nr:LysM peptidoglycan-binding domain-containing protein [bacterium]